MNEKKDEPVKQEDGNQNGKEQQKQGNFSFVCFFVFKNPNKVSNDREFNRECECITGQQ